MLSKHLISTTTVSTPNKLTTIFLVKTKNCHVGQNCRGKRICHGPPSPRPLEFAAPLVTLTGGHNPWETCGRSVIEKDKRHQG